MLYRVPADCVPDDVLTQVRERPCGLRHTPDGFERKPGESCWPPRNGCSAFDYLSRYEEAEHDHAITPPQLADAVRRAAPVPPSPRGLAWAAPVGSMGDDPDAIEHEYPGWKVERHGDRWVASCPAKTVHGDSPDTLRLAIDSAIGV